MISGRLVRIQLAAFAVLTALGVSYVGASYIGVADRLFHRFYTVSADFGSSGGIFSGAEVTYRGVPAGRVGRLRLSDDGVLVDLELRRGTRIPADTLAVVANRSAVGEQYLDLQPRRRGGPFLEAGGLIPRSRTRTPLDSTTLLLNLDRLVRSVDRKDLTTVIDELGRALQGSGPDLQRLIDSIGALTVTAQRNLPQTVALLEDGLTLLRTQNDQAGAIRSFARDLALLTDQLRASDPDLRKVLDRGVTASVQISRLLRDNRSTLPLLLGNLIAVGQVTTARLNGIEQLLVVYPQAVAASFTIAPGDGTAHFGLVLNLDDPPPCVRGYQSTRKRVPQDTSPRPANTNARCAEPRGSATSVRGAQNAPRGPSGPAAGAPASRGGRAASGGGDQAAGASSAAGAGSGSVAGDPLAVGSFGGQQRQLGKDSWKWLLIGPLAG
jgi:phospholipid/cholesterol/gamma-HCH transport system substrate-binding protein